MRFSFDKSFGIADVNAGTFEKFPYVVIPAKAGIQKALKNTGFPFARE